MTKKTSEQLTIAQIIAKSLHAKISDQEKSKLEKWIEKSDQNRKDYKASINRAIMSQKIKPEADIDVISAKNKIIFRLERDKSLKSNRKWLKYAAVFIGLIAATYFLHDQTGTIDQQFEINEDDITLEMGNGDIKVISVDGTESIVNKKGELVVEKKGNRLYYSDQATNNELVYNKLSIPYGKKLGLVLSDGTEVFLNAGSTFKYPENFIKGQSRNVYLEGEAYFNVKHNSEDSFIVNTEKFNTKVFGTSFNISTYPDEIDPKVVLVEGKVGVYRTMEKFENEHEVILTPNQMAVLNDGNNEITTTNVDPSIYTSWMNDILIFKSESFENIFRRLEREYNVEIVNNSDLFEGEKFTGRFKEVKIDYLMNVLKANIEFEYQITENKIIINSKHTHMN